MVWPVNALRVSPYSIQATAITTLTVNLVLSANLMAVMAAASTGTTTAAFAKTILSGEKSKHYSNGK